jgi:hypothetical protein
MSLNQIIDPHNTNLQTIYAKNFIGNLIGNFTGNVTGSASTITTPLSGDVSGLQSATVVATVGGSTASAINSATTLVSSSTSSSLPLTLAQRDANANISFAKVIASTLQMTTGAASGSTLTSDASGNASWTATTQTTTLTGTWSGGLPTSPTMTINVTRTGQTVTLSFKTWTVALPSNVSSRTKFSVKLPSWAHPIKADIDTAYGCFFPCACLAGGYYQLTLFSIFNFVSNDYYINIEPLGSAVYPNGFPSGLPFALLPQNITFMTDAP